MKPVFEKEKKFLEFKLRVDLPKNCWRKGSKLYLNHFDEKPFLTFKVDLLHDQIVIKKYETPKHKNYTLEEEYELVKNKLESKVQESILETKAYILQNPKYKRFVSISGGKDSDVMKHIVDIAIDELNKDSMTEEEFYELQNTLKVLLNKSELEYKQVRYNYNLIAFNTSNDTAQTYKHLKQHHNMTKDQIISPEKGFYPWLMDDKNYFTPSRFVRNCCSTYKEGQLSKIMDKDEKTLTFLGMRSSESNKRSHYDWDLNEAQLRANKKLNVPNNWKRFLPIVKWTDAEVWLYILSRKMQYNPMYDMGFHRIGCLICPYQQDYIEMLIKNYYPKQWKRWTSILTKGYEIYGIGSRLKWDILEWCEGGKWKNAVSKEYELTTLKATPERIKELSELKGISEEIAAKYFKKTCSCGKKLNPTEIAMFLKLTGRFEGVEDNRVYLCKKCLSEKLNITTKEYKEMTIEFSQRGCELF